MNVVPFPNRSRLEQTQSHAPAVRIEGFRASDWAVELEPRFNWLTALQIGWDGYRGRPVSFTCAQFAAMLLERIYNPRVEAPSLVPGSDGTIQIEWHYNDFDIEIDILAPYQIVAYRLDCLTGNEEEFVLDSDLSVLAVWLKELSLRDLMLGAIGS
jgi:hypothetical protein